MDPTLETLATIAGAAPVTAILNGVLLKALGPAFDAGRFGPLFALVLGIVVTVAASFALGLSGSANIGQAVLTGIIAGASAIGIYETANGTVLGK